MEDGQVRPVAAAVRLVHAGLPKESRAESVAWNGLAEAEIAKRVLCHVRRHSFATHLLENGRTSARCRCCWGTAMRRRAEIYTQVMNKRAGGVTSPLG